MRGQVTIFIIIAILIIIGGALLFMAVPGEQDSSVFQDRVLGVNNYVQGCIDLSSEDALFLVGYSGGLAFPVIELSGNNPNIPKQTVTFGDDEVNTWQYAGFNLMPSEQYIEEFQLAGYVDQQLKECDLTNFTGLTITPGEPKVSASILDEAVVFDVFYPITISSFENQASIEEFRTVHDVRLRKMMAQAAELINSAKWVQGYFDATLIADSEFDIKVAPLNETFVYTITDLSSNLRGKPFTLRFAARYVP